jgi:ParB-like chromosome segregation protein Spo0J
MKIQQWSVEKPRPYPGNPRRTETAVAKVADSIREFGFQQPIVVDADGVVIVGHVRLLAAKSLGLRTVPVVVADLSEKKARAYRLADNRSNELSDWDDDLLKAELNALKDDLQLTGFAAEDLDDLSIPADALRFSEPPPEVSENVADMETIRQRRKGNEEKANKSDTERYLVVVFRDRAARERMARRLGLPEDERYVAARAVRIEPRLGIDGRITDDRNVSAASAKKSGATG